MERKAASAPVSTVDNWIHKIAESVSSKFGADAMAPLSEHSSYGAVKTYISTGHWATDYIVSGKTSGGGVPVSRLTEIFGGWSSGKSLIIAHLIASVQKMGGIAALDDTEHAYMKDFGSKIGVDNNKLLYSASESVEEVFDKMAYVIEMVMKDHPNTPVLYAWDSLALVASMKELNDELLGEGESYHTEKAKAINRGTRKVVSLLGKSNVALVISNQTRKKFGIQFGNPETTPGGDAVPFWASVRLRLAAKAKLQGEDKEINGVTADVSTVKNKINEPFKSCSFSMSFAEGISYMSGAVDSLVKMGVIKQSSPGWYSVGDKKYQKVALEAYFTDNPQVLDGLLG